MKESEKEEILKKILDLKLKRQTPEVNLEIQRLQQLLDNQ